MKRLTCPILPALAAVAALGLLFVSSGIAQAQTRYQIETIVRLGERAGDTLLPASAKLLAGGLNDSGRLLFVVGSDSGDRLFQYADGQFILIAAGGLDGPIGKWPKPFGANLHQYNINQSGDVVFIGYRLPITVLGTFLWEAKTRTLTAVVLKDMPATDDLTFTIPGGIPVPAINNPGDIVLIGTVKGPTTPAGNAVFFLGHDHQLKPVLLTGQELPGGGQAASSDMYRPSITDSGAIAFVTQRRGQGAGHSAYRWEQGTLTPLLLVGTDVPEVGKIADVRLVVANNQNRDVLVSARVAGSGEGLYRVAEGKILPVAVPGQEMPDGGKLKSVNGDYQARHASQAGEHAFRAALEDGTAAIYQVDAAGNLSLVIKSGTPTALGTITGIVSDSPAVLNSKGQVALTVQIDKGPDTLVLLTPTVP
jgi:hypothetical protein